MATKVFLFFLMTMMIFSTSFAQNFEGKVMYKNTYKSKIGVSDQQLQEMMGTSQEYLIKGGNYRTSTNGTFLQWQLYVNSDNKLYNKMSNSPIIYWMDGAVNKDEVLKAEMNKGVIDILGHKCDELILTCKSGVQKYYFSPKLKVDASLYEKHKFGNFYEFISRSKAMPLKIVMDTPQFSVESIATEIIPMKLADDQFVLPGDSKIEKSPY
jgi:hypothetical protein